MLTVDFFRALWVTVDFTFAPSRPYLPQPCGCQCFHVLEAIGVAEKAGIWRILAEYTMAQDHRIHCAGTT
jgi:hypothetical protein